MISFGHCPTYLNFLFDSVSQDIDFAISFFRVMFFSVLRLILCFRTLVFCILCLNCGSLKMPLISILRSQSGETELPTMPDNPVHCSSFKSEDFFKNSSHYCTKQFVLLEKVSMHGQSAPHSEPVYILRTAFTGFLFKPGRFVKLEILI